MARPGGPLLGARAAAGPDGVRVDHARVVDARGAVALLGELGLVSADDVVTGGLEVHDVSRRHRNLRVTLGDDRGYLIKQAVDDDRARTLAHEARVLQLLAADGAAGPGRDDAAGALHWSDATSTLVVGVAPASRSLAVYYRRRRRFPLGLAEALAQALAATHAHADAATREALASVVGLPLVFSFDRPDVSLYYGASAASLDLFRIVGTTTGLAEHIAAARDAWRPRCLIHGDARLDNAVVVPVARARDGTVLRLVDWEMAMWGDPAWDVATVVSEYLSLWLDFSPVSGLTPPEEFLDHGVFQLDDLQPSLRAFWARYAATLGRAGGGPADDDPGAFWLRALRFAALRLVQTSYEAAQYAPSLTGQVVLKLQLAANMLEDPVAAGIALAGVSEVAR